MAVFTISQLQKKHMSSTVKLIFTVENEALQGTTINLNITECPRGWGLEGEITCRECEANYYKNLNNS